MSSHNTFDFFLSHYQKTGGNVALALKLLLKEKDPNLNIFLDVDDLDNIHNLEENVKNTNNFVLVLTEGVLTRPFVLHEVKTAVSCGKKIFLVWDKDSCEFPNPDTAPEEFRSLIKDVLLTKAIRWEREKMYRDAAIDNLLSKMVKSQEENVIENAGSVAVQLGKSMPTSQSTYVQFINSSNRDVDFYWVDFSGNEVFYQKVEAGKESIQQTYIDHLWVARDPDTKKELKRGAAGPSLIKLQVK